MAMETKMTDKNFIFYIDYKISAEALDQNWSNVWW